jgi:hypothetical protein
LENLYLTETMSVQTKYYAFFCVFVSSAWNQIISVRIKYAMILMPKMKKIISFTAMCYRKKDIFWLKNQILIIFYF